MRPGTRAVAARAASVLLRYPEPATLDLLPTVAAAVAELPQELAAPLSEVTAYLATGEPRVLAATYVETFDFRRRCCLYLTYYTHGDTRARGQALVTFAAAYRQAGLAVAGGELPDFLPAVLELAAIAGQPGWSLLAEHRVGLDLLAAALGRDHSPYRPVLSALTALLPPVDAAAQAAAGQLAASGPPAELVGLEPFPTHSGGRR